MAFDPTNIIDEDKPVAFTLPTIEVGKTSGFDPTNIVEEPSSSQIITKSSAQFDPTTAVELDDISQTRSFTKAAVGSAALGIASTPGMLYGARFGALAGSPFGIPGLIIGGLGGGLAGFIGTSKIVETAFDLLPEEAKATFGYDKATRQQEIEQNPESSFTGALTGNLALFRPGAIEPLILKTASGVSKVISPLVQRTAGAGVGTALEGVNQIQQGKFDPLHLVESAAFGFAAVKPTKITTKMSNFVNGTRPEQIDLETSRIDKIHFDWMNDPDFVSLSSDPKESHISFESLKSKNAADVTAVIDLNKELERLGVTKEVSEKLYRYAEDTALGNETINNEITSQQIKINDLYNRNRKLMFDNDLKSRVNTEGKVKWSDLPLEVRNEIQENDTMIKMYKEQIKKTEAKVNTREVLTQEEQHLYDNIYRPWKAKLDNHIKYLQEEGVIEPLNMNEQQTGTFASRYRLPVEGTKSFFTTVKESLGWSTTIDPVSGDSVLYKTPAGQDRNLFTLVDEKGLRKVVQISNNEKGDHFLNTWVNGKIKSSLNIGQVPIKAGDVLGRYKVQNANRAELELNTPYKYSNNPFLVLGMRLAEVRDMVRTHQFQKDILTNPINKSRIHKIEANKPIPEGFREARVQDGAEALPKTPELKNYAFDQRLAEAIEDFNKPIKTSAMGKLSNVVVTNMMIVPFIHMMNEVPHWIGTRGASGFIDPRGLYRLGKTFPEAIRIVNERGPVFQKILRENGRLMSANITNNAYLNETYALGLKEVRNTKEFKEIAKLIGESPFKLYARLSNTSQNTMWKFRDVLLVQAALEKEMLDNKGIGSAVTSAERHLPQYRLPPRVGEFTVPYYVPKIGGKIIGGKAAEKFSRTLSNVLQNNSIFIFTRYKHGMVSSILNTAKDLMMTDPNLSKSKQFKEGLDSALAYGLLLAAFYPGVLDPFAKALNDLFDTGFEESKFRRGGVLHLFDTIRAISDDEKDQMALVSSFVTLNPVLQSAIESLANFTIYNRKDIAPPGDYRTQIEDLKNYFIQRFPMMQSAVQAQSDWGGGLAQFLFKMFDIKTKTFEQMNREEDKKDQIESLREERIYQYENPE
jgi:hypothetical protein